MLHKSSKDPRLLADLIKEGRDRRALQTALGGGAAAVDSSGSSLSYIPNSLVDAKGDLLVGSADNIPVVVPVGVEGYQLVARDAEVAGILWAAQYADILVYLDGSSAPIGTGPKVDITIDFECTIIAWTMFADAAASARIDLWKTTYAGAPPTVANTIIAADANKPRLVAVQKATGGMTGWSPVTIAAGDVIRVNLDTNNTAQRISMTLKVRKT